MHKLEAYKYDCIDVNYDGKFLKIRTPDNIFFFNIINGEIKEKLKGCFIPLSVLMPGVDKGEL